MALSQPIRFAVAALSFVLVSSFITVLAQIVPFGFWHTSAPVSIGAFSITGITGVSDTTADAWLVSDTNPFANFGAASGATSYDVTVRDAGNTTTVCQRTGATLTTDVAISSCGLTHGTSYKLYVLAKAGASTRAAANDGFSFTVDITPPTANAITGVTGGSDSTVDAYLISNGAPTINWTAFTNASTYKVTIRDQMGTDVVCAEQTTASTSLSMTGCPTLTNRTVYRAYVSGVSASGQLTTAATNQGFSFTVESQSPGAFTISGITGLGTQPSTRTTRVPQIPR